MTIGSTILTHIDFWDVGQGDCSVLNFSDESVLLIDTGSRRSPVVSWLADRPRKIHAIVLTHVDADHAGALCPIVDANKATIDAVYFFDFERRDEKFARLFNCVRIARRTHKFVFDRPQAGRVLWQSAAQYLELQVLYPNYQEQVEAKSENSASALIGLFLNGQLMITWPGDLTVAKIKKKLGNSQMYLLVGPHHGGPEDRRSELKERPIAFQPENAFISVGTVNQPNHPRANYLKALAKKGCNVICSELTNKCQPDLDTNSKPVVQGSALLGLPAHYSGVPCRGTFRLLFRSGKFTPDEYQQLHQAKIQKLSQPLCLRSG